MTHRTQEAEASCLYDSEASHGYIVRPSLTTKEKRKKEEKKKKTRNKFKVLIDFQLLQFFYFIIIVVNLLLCQIYKLTLYHKYIVHVENRTYRAHCFPGPSALWGS